MKKINGYLVVKFNARELREYEGTALGEYGVIDAELYTGNLDVDRGAMEYLATADGGLKRIADIMEKVVPFGSDLYCRRLGSPDHAHQRSTGNVCPDFQERLYT